MRRWSRSATAAIVGLLLHALVVPSLADESRNRTPVSPSPDPPLPVPDRDYYWTAPDGTRLAISVWLPGSSATGRVPAVVYQTRYGRQSANAAANLRALPELPVATVVVDVRGTTASFGDRLLEVNAEAADMAPLFKHLAAQDWCDGRLVTAGQSYLADTADVATGQSAAALRGALVRETEYDVYAHAFEPGGVQNRWALEEYDRWTLPMDTGRYDSDDRHLDCVARPIDCRELGATVTPVAGTEGLAELQHAMTGRRRWRAADFAAVVARDTKSANGYSFFDWSPARWRTAQRTARVPVQVWGSWMDSATAEAALARFRSVPEAPVEVYITANDHAYTRRTDPLLPDQAGPVPTVGAQRAAMAAFVRDALDDLSPPRVIHYYVLGDASMRTTSVWPPAGVVERTWYLASARRLSVQRPPAGAVDYEVDFTATAGSRTRWTANLGFPAAYGDRAALAGRLATFTSEPLSADAELAGYVRVELHLAARTRDPAVHVYLDDVAPDGDVRYVTEGMLRLIHRATTTAGRLPYDQGPDRHSYAAADVRAVPVGQYINAEIVLQPVAARLRSGHRLRLSIAGADASNFARYSDGEPDTFRIGLGGRSRVAVPLRPWTGSER